MELRRRLVIALLLLATVAVAATCGYRILGENVGWLDAMYMTMITLTTVGYGEIVETAHNPVLRVFNMFMVTFGIGLMLYVFSVSTAFIVDGELKNIFWRRKMQRRIAEFQKHIVVCGAGETGLPAISELLKSGKQVVVVDADRERIRKCESNFPQIATVLGDATDEEVLEQAGLSRAAGVLATLPSDKDNLVVTISVHQDYPSLRIIARCTDRKMSEKMLKAGASSIVSPNVIGGMRLASEMIRPHVVTFLDLMLKERSKTLRIEEISVPFHSSWVHQPLSQLSLREKYALCCLALRHSGDESYRFNPPDGEVIKGNTVIVVMGDVEHVSNARHAAEASRAVAR